MAHIFQDINSLLHEKSINSGVIPVGREKVGNKGLKAPIKPGFIVIFGAQISQGLIQPAL